MKNFSVKTLAIFVFVIMSFASQVQSSVGSNLSLCEKVGLEARSGDLIFIAVDSYVFKQIAHTTNTWTSHVGIIFREKNSWVVFESRVPKSTVTPLCDYLGRALGELVEVRRFQQPLARSTIKLLKSEATNRLGFYYHTGFDYDNDSRMFCSKFVFDIFLQAGIEVGKLETLEELFEQNADADYDFWNRWYLGRIPWDRRTVTPASQLNDSKFMSVFSNNIKTENNPSRPSNVLVRGH